MKVAQQIALFLAFYSSSSVIANSAYAKYLQLPELNGGTYTAVGPAGDFHATIHLIAMDDTASGKFTLDFHIDGRAYQCLATLIQAGEIIAGRADHCVWLDTRAANPTVCNLYYRVGSEGVHGTSYCYGAAGYDSTLVPGQQN